MPLYKANPYDIRRSVGIITFVGSVNAATDQSIWAGLTGKFSYMVGFTIRLDTACRALIKQNAGTIAFDIDLAANEDYSLLIGMPGVAQASVGGNWLFRHTAGAAVNATITIWGYQAANT